MKRIFFIAIAMAAVLNVNAQKISYDKIEAKSEFTLKLLKMIGISQDSSDTYNRDNYFITERAAKAYARSHGGSGGIDTLPLHNQIQERLRRILERGDTIFTKQSSVNGLSLKVYLPAGESYNGATLAPYGFNVYADANHYAQIQDGRINLFGPFPYINLVGMDGNGMAFGYDSVQKHAYIDGTHTTFNIEDGSRYKLGIVSHTDLALPLLRDGIYLGPSSWDFVHIGEAVYNNPAPKSSFGEKLAVYGKFIVKNDSSKFEKPIILNDVPTGTGADSVLTIGTDGIIKKRDQSLMGGASKYQTINNGVFGDLTQRNKLTFNSNQFAAIDNSGSNSTDMYVSALDQGIVSGLPDSLLARILKKDSVNAYVTPKKLKDTIAFYLKGSNNLSDISNATTALGNLGATTVGKSIFGMANPSATSFIRINGDNSVTTRTVPNLYSDMGIYAIYTTGTSSANTYTLAGGTTGFLTYTTGFYIDLYFNANNTGAATLNVSFLGAKSIVKNTSTALVADDIVTGKLYRVVYDGTNFRLLNPGGYPTGTGVAAYSASPAFTGTPTAPTAAPGTGGTQISTNAYSDASSLKAVQDSLKRLYFNNSIGTYKLFYKKNDSTLVSVSLEAGTNVTMTKTLDANGDSVLTISATGGGASPAGNNYNLQYKSGSSFATPASDSLKWRPGLGLGLLGNLSVDDGSGATVIVDAAGNPVFRSTIANAWVGNIGSRFFQTGDFSQAGFFTAKSGTPYARLGFLATKFTFATNSFSTAPDPTENWEFINTTDTKVASIDDNGTSNFKGGVIRGYKSVTATYTILAKDYTLDCSGTFTNTLPTAVGRAGQIYNIKNSGTGTITIATTASETMDGATTITVATQYLTTTVQSNGTNWITL